MLSPSCPVTVVVRRHHTHYFQFRKSRCAIKTFVRCRLYRSLLIVSLFPTSSHVPSFVYIFGFPLTVFPSFSFDTNKWRPRVSASLKSPKCHPLLISNPHTLSLCEHFIYVFICGASASDAVSLGLAVLQAAALFPRRCTARNNFTQRIWIVGHMSASFYAPPCLLLWSVWRYRLARIKRSSFEINKQWARKYVKNNIKK